MRGCLEDPFPLRGSPHGEAVLCRIYMVSCQVLLWLAGCLHPWQCCWLLLLVWERPGWRHMAPLAPRQALLCQCWLCYLFGIFSLLFLYFFEVVCSQACGMEQREVLSVFYEGFRSGGPCG